MPEDTQATRQNIYIAQLLLTAAEMFVNSHTAPPGGRWEFLKQADRAWTEAQGSF